MSIFVLHTLLTFSAIGLFLQKKIHVCISCYFTHIIIDLYSNTNMIRIHLSLIFAAIFSDFFYFFLLSFGVFGNNEIYSLHVFSVIIP